MSKENNDSLSKPGADSKAHTPAYDNSFGPNTDKLSHILRFSTKAVQGYFPDLKAALSGLDVAAQTNPGGVEGLTDIAKRLVSTTSELTAGVLAIHEFLPVLMVALTEAYLKDVLVYAAGIDPTLMERSEQSASYNDVLNATSLADVIEQLRRHSAK